MINILKLWIVLLSGMILKKGEVKDLNILAVIPARGGSKGIPRKYKINVWKTIN